MFTQQRQTFRSDQSTEVQLSIETTANTDLKNRDNSETQLNSLDKPSRSDRGALTCVPLVRRAAVISSDTSNHLAYGAVPFLW